MLLASREFQAIRPQSANSVTKASRRMRSDLLTKYKKEPVIPGPIKRQESVTRRPTSAFLVTETRPNVYETDKELMADIKTMIGGMIPIHTIRSMRGSMQPRARVKWDRYTRWAENMTTQMQERLTDVLGPSDASAMLDLPLDHEFKNWEEAYESFLDLHQDNRGELKDEWFDDWEFDFEDEPLKSWWELDHALLEAEPGMVTRNIYQNRERDRQTLTELVGSLAKQETETYYQVIKEQFMEKFLVAQEIEKDLKEGRFNPAVQLRVEEIRKKLKEADKAQPDLAAKENVSIPIKSLFAHGDRRDNVNSFEHFVDYHLIDRAIKMAKVEGLPQYVPFLLLIKQSFLSREELSLRLELIRDLLEFIPGFGHFLQVKAFLLPTTFHKIPGYDKILSEAESTWVKPKLAMTLKQAQQYADEYNKFRLRNETSRFNDTLADDIEKASTRKEDPTISEESTDLDREALSPPTTSEDSEDAFRLWPDYSKNFDSPDVNKRRESEREHDRMRNPLYWAHRIAVVSFKTKSLLLSEVLVPYLGVDISAETDSTSMIQRTKCAERNAFCLSNLIRVIDIPSRWLLAFKKTKWPESEYAKDAIMIHNPTGKIAFEETLSKKRLDE